MGEINVKLAALIAHLDKTEQVASTGGACRASTTPLPTFSRRLNDLEVPTWLVCSVGGDGW